MNCPSVTILHSHPVRFCLPAIKLRNLLFFTLNARNGQRTSGIAMTLLLLAACGLSRTASAQVVADTFSTDTVTAGFWEAETAGGPTINQSLGKLWIAFPADSSGDVPYAKYNSVWALRGDFDVQVDYKLLQWPAMNGIRVGLALNTATGLLPNMHRVSLGVNEQVGWPRESYTSDFANGTFFRTATGDQNGRLRLTRVQGAITGYYWDIKHGTWVKMGSEVISNDDAWLALQAWAGGGAFAGLPVETALANFRVNKGQLVYPAGSTNFGLSAGEVPGTQSLTGTVNLSTPAPAGGYTVHLKNSNAAVVCPAQVTVPAGMTTTTFTLSTNGVTSKANGVISTQIGSVTFNCPLEVRPIQIQQLSLAPIPVTGGSPVTGTVTLEEPAAPYDIVVSLSSGNTAAAKPAVASITIPKGQSTGTFTINTYAVKHTTSVKISARANGASVSEAITVNK
jgi:hypothetical protein